MILSCWNVSQIVWIQKQNDIVQPVTNCQKRNLQSTVQEKTCNFQEEETYYYPCPCGDRFAITKEELQCGEEVATCPSCSLIIKVILVFMVNLVFIDLNPDILC